MAEAERLAPYQFTMSQEYLEKARSEAADSDHKIAMQLAKEVSRVGGPGDYRD